MTASKRTNWQQSAMSRRWQYWIGCYFADVRGARQTQRKRSQSVPQIFPRMPLKMGVSAVKRVVDANVLSIRRPRGISTFQTRLSLPGSAARHLFVA